jgi:hypothetical protein
MEGALYSTVSLALLPFSPRRLVSIMASALLVAVIHSARRPSVIRQVPVPVLAAARESLPQATPDPPPRTPHTRTPAHSHHLCVSGSMEFLTFGCTTRQ